MDGGCRRGGRAVRTSPAVVRSGQLGGGDHFLSLGADARHVQRDGAAVVAAVPPLAVLTGAAGRIGEVNQARPCSRRAAIGQWAAIVRADLEPLARAGQEKPRLVVATVD